MVAGFGAKSGMDGCYNKTDAVFQEFRSAMFRFWCDAEAATQEVNNGGWWRILDPFQALTQARSRLQAAMLDMAPIFKRAYGPMPPTLEKYFLTFFFLHFFTISGRFGPFPDVEKKSTKNDLKKIRDHHQEVNR